MEAYFQYGCVNVCRSKAAAEAATTILARADRVA